MQVKKFEAKTMKDALEMVKVHLGPEAIILSAKDTQRGFGLMGEKSVEVTAAVSEETLRKKKFAEAKLKEDLRERFHQIPASRQRQFIQKATAQKADVPARSVVTEVGAPIAPEIRMQLKGLRYIDIEDDERMSAPVAPLPPKARRDIREEFIEVPHLQKRSARVVAAAAAAAQAAKATFSAPPAQSAVAAARDAVMAGFGSAQEVEALQSQVKELKALVERFQNMPQIPLSMHPGAEQGLPFELSNAYQRLTGQGMDPHLVTSILRKAQKEIDNDTLKKSALVDAWLVKHILGMVDINNKPYEGRYHVFIGSTGQGKSTTLIKFASQLMLKEKRTIAIISLDSLKLGASDQMRLYAQILNVPFAIVRNPEEWAVADQKLSRVQHILVDCPGLSLHSQQEIDWLKRMLPPTSMGGNGISRSIHYVQSVLARDEEAAQIAGRYQSSIGFQDVILTRLDESSRFGMLVNFQERFRTPLHSFGVGSRIPEDFELASKERVVDVLFKL